VKEKPVELRLIKQVKAAEGMCLKIMGMGGWPDRLVLLPQHRLALVETKAPKGKLRPLQEVFRRRAAALGIPVAVLYTSEQVDAWVAEQLAIGQRRGNYAWLVEQVRQRAEVLDDPWARHVIEDLEARNKEH
jgi:hypothetical protein